MTNTTTNLRAHQDYGLFGPDSITWKVFSYPTSFTVGFLRTVVSEMYEPFLLASVDHTEAVMNRPDIRYDRTLQYVSTIAFHDSKAIVKAADILFKVHSQIRGKEPLSGLEYDANHPEAQLWIHLTQWHSVLLAYERFGPGPLTEEEDRQYWAECREAARFQTIDPETVPASREEMRAYYASMRPLLCATERTQIIVEHLLQASASLMQDAPWFLIPARPIFRAVMREATLATLPGWLNKMGGIRRRKVAGVLAALALKSGAALVDRSPRQIKVKIVAFLSPSTASVMSPVLMKLQPENAVTVSAAAAWEQAGKRMPREQYAAFCETRVAAGERAPKDQGASTLLQFA